MPSTLEDRLQEAVGSLDLPSELESIVESIGATDLASVSAILRFMEGNPNLDFGMPGPLVHFVEDLAGRGYEEALLESLRRCPTPHTVWMLNRVINATTVTGEREKYLAALRDAGADPRASDATRHQVSEFLQFQGHVPE